MSTIYKCENVSRWDFKFKKVPLETHVNSRSDIFRIPELLVVRIPIQTDSHVVQHRSEHLVQKLFKWILTRWWLKAFNNHRLTIASVWAIRYDHFNQLDFQLKRSRENSKTIDSSLQEIWCLLPWDQLQLYADFMMPRSRVVGHPLSSLLAACHTIFFNFIAIKSENSD